MTKTSTDQAQALWASMPFIELLGAELVAAGPQEVRGRVAWDPARCTDGGVLHGGLLMALADSTGALCAFLNLPDDRHATTTIESKTNFLRAVRGGDVTATSRPLHAGRRVAVVETELCDEDGRLVAKVTQTQAVIAPAG
ncbi:MAG TPA: PaaI family thioesterase [Baekduia sp.]|nr:PaaI family thioesterase [Baekduia sp.]